ncbi:hypothetical protein DJ69_13900 [Halorubrum persicum]|uniref:Schlafen AlbA-2 domain-containing protein n=1 Tax=Halorubrum persicum TaxID=1383844 RepID=A0A2G1WGF0_9EURY|nr:ATP-binding protein [Halorubrum persicum]PHQ38025.1 hypothetical protein DJ69_13900 [Halorubrum persicum]
MPIYVQNRDLFSLLNSEENDVLDFKSSELLTNPNANNRYKLAKHIVGFANNKGGRLVIGVNDEGEPEGRYITEEGALGTISEINDTKIDPSVDFSYSIYSEDADDLSEGSVFVLEIKQNSNPLPLAVVERSGRKIRKREYRIRAGESTRLVTNEELVSLFERDRGSSLNYSTNIRYLLKEEGIPADLKYKPNYHYDFERHFDQLSSEENSLLEETLDYDGSGDIPDEMYTLQSALVISSLLLGFQFKLLHESALSSEVSGEVEELSFGLKDLRPEDVILESESNPLLEKTDMEKPGFLPTDSTSTAGFRIPEGSKVCINENFTGFSISSDQFTLNISIEHLSWGVGLPERHPESVREHAAFGRQDPDRKNSTLNAHLEISSEFPYPNQDFRQYKLYKAYCEEIVNIFQNQYNWESYIEELPHEKIFQLEEKVDEILDLID